MVFTDTTLPSYMQVANERAGEFKTLSFFKTAPHDTEKTNNHFLGIIEGYASTSHIDRDNEMVSPEALGKAAQQLLDNPTVFFNHQHLGVPVGVVLDSKYIKDKGLYVKVGISKNHPDIWQSIQEGSLKRFSIAGRFDSDTAENIEKDVDGHRIQYRLIKDVELWEVSVVGVPANPHAEFSIGDALHKYFVISGEKQSMPDNNKVEEPKVATLTAPVQPAEPMMKATDGSKLQADLQALQKKYDEMQAALQKQQLEKEAAEKLQHEAELAEFTKWKELKGKDEPKPESLKSTAPRSTVLQEQRQMSNQVIVKSADEAFNWQLTEFVKSLTDPEDVKIDCYGSQVNKPVNLTSYRREAKRRT